MGLMEEVLPITTIYIFQNFQELQTLKKLQNHPSASPVPAGTPKSSGWMYYGWQHCKTLIINHKVCSHWVNRTQWYHVWEIAIH